MQKNESAKLANIRMLEFIATKLGKLCDEVVFLGGCTTSLFMTEKNSHDVRHTLDVDCIVDVISLIEFHRIEKQLRSLGFKQSLLEDVICRWHYDDVILDVMPTNEEILGFGNRWYKDAIQYANTHSLTETRSIKVVTAPHFLATKFEAFKSRGKMDFYASSDFEDIIAVLDCRIEIVDEIQKSNNDIKNYLIDSLSSIYKSRSFSGAIPGHFAIYGSLADERIELFEQKLESIIKE